MEPKIFNELGFLSKEGKSFVNDGFIKEARRVLSTAKCSNDVIVIGSILKTIIGDLTFEEAQNLSKIKNKSADLNTDFVENSDQKITDIYKLFLRQ